jgi:hypothetical protein
VNEIVIPDSIAYNKADIAQLGSQLSEVGLSSQAVRGLIDQIRGAAEQVALAITPVILKQVQEINSAQQASLYRQIELLPTKLGYIDRHQVLMIVRNVYATQPRS